MLPVDARSGPVVLDHAVDGVGVGDRAQPVGVVVSTHALRITDVPRARVSIDELLGGLVGLGKEPPVPPGGGKSSIAALERLYERYAVHDSEAGDRLRVIEREPKRDVAAPVVASDGKTVVAQRLHQRAHVACHRALRRLLVVGHGGRRCGLAVAPKVRANHCVVTGQQWRNPVPSCVSARVAVQEEQRRPSPAVPHPQGHLTDVDTV